MKINEIREKAKALGIKVMATTKKGRFDPTDSEGRRKFRLFWNGERLLRSVGLLL